ncbi:hypothetical protein CAC42_6257 [Sphaceloma murrayae]|uniref:G-patch domain-containing protein n=1 Tax=Sphaceloma murrayae TaxID=2082308 RepID=A0A2K1QU06_9PEZI|nr:hypothetical protein CAC42_6257 [Sphaceloma murrayae]
MTAYDDDEYEVPLKDQRFFGAGIKRKRVPFVPSSDSTLATTSTTSPSTGEGVRNAYLDIVLRRRQSASNEKFTSNSEGEKQLNESRNVKVCSICRLPISMIEGGKRHEATIAHQICLPHSHPPSAVDRQRKGLTILEGHGWDPDQRQGLGVTGEGRLHPVRAQEKLDRLGLGHNKDDSEIKSSRTLQQVKPAVQKLDAGKVRLLESESKRKDKQMRDLFYRDEDVERYLGSG